MTLHAAIEKILQEAGRPMTTLEIADSLNKNKWYQKKDGSKINSFQIYRRTKNYPQIFDLNGATVSLVAHIITKLPKPHPLPKAIIQSEKSSTKDEHYVLDICDKILRQTSLRQHKFDFLFGDPNSNGSTAKLPVDAYCEKLQLVIEYRERQHMESVTFFDKPHRLTVSGVHRGEQRKIYDERRRKLIPKNNLILVEISYTDFNYDNQKRIIRNEKHDTEVVRKLLQKYVERI